ncbi:Pentapeptide repeat-containing protein [Allokutzneria albata]|uniref:Pentapeptide repeat-containing protein n=1 Tax=Allokutzneria albata TaxID=211114 RepID=A0A1H0CCG6_ALLAB|nr:Pentapeptide repeat-containing protein [Allokutzneria albata]
MQQKDIDQAHQEQVAAANQAHQERVATATEADAAERRVTELYTKAVEQLGSDKAPVRLGGMYALERLAQNVPEQRQTIVNVLCAYLRMPYAPVAVSSASVHDPAPPATGEDAIPAGEQHSNLRGTAAPRQHAEHHEQERQVRLTAQRILTAHLNTGNDPEHPVETFWPDIDLDLTGATLLDFDFTGCRASNAHFTQAQFHGGAGFHEVIFDSKAGFNEALFHGDVEFNGVQFREIVEFSGVRFYCDASFHRAHFHGNVGFYGAQFRGSAGFHGVRFHGNVGFNGAQFHDRAGFYEARFDGGAVFNEARFDGDAGFHEAQSHGPVGFSGVKFHGDVGFYEAHFHGNVGFYGAQFRGSAGFHGVRFHGNVGFNGAQFHGMIGFDGVQVDKRIEFEGVRVRVDMAHSARREWPGGYVIRGAASDEETHIDGAEGTWGHLLRTDES